MTAADLSPDLDAIQARADAALFHAPYKVVDDTYGKKVVQTSNHPDLRPYVLASKMAPVIADFVAEAPADIAALLALVREQQARLDEYEAEHGEHTTDNQGRGCPACAAQIRVKARERAALAAAEGA